MDFETILYQKDGSVLTITLNRPGVLNALNTAVKDELREAIGKASVDDEVRCIVLTGAGRAFYEMRASVRERLEILDPERIDGPTKVSV